jgi:hypothetical protein
LHTDRGDGNTNNTGVNFEVVDVKALVEVLAQAVYDEGSDCYKLSYYQFNELVAKANEVLKAGTSKSNNATMARNSI